LDAACSVIHRHPEIWDAEFDPPPVFNVDEEIDYIDAMCAAGRVAAVGECGLDRFYVTDQRALDEQERVLLRLIEVAMKHDLPLILHTRKAEARTLEILQHCGVEKADFHCFGGKLKLGRRIAEAGYYLSIPSAVHRIDQFQRLAAALPLDRILTETDAPFMGPHKGVKNEPATVPLAVKKIAEVREQPEQEVSAAIRKNFQDLFGSWAPS